MVTRRTNQEWKILLEQYESCNVTQRVFCKRHGVSLSTFYAKRQRLQTQEKSKSARFVKAEVVEKTTRYQTSQLPIANMTLSINDVELTIPQGTPASYLVELIGALS